MAHHTSEALFRVFRSMTPVFQALYGDGISRRRNGMILAGDR
jgi:hypothetical protein